MPSASNFHGISHNIVDEGGTGEIFHQFGVGTRGCQVKVGGQAQGRIPAVGNKSDPVIMRHPGDPSLFAYAAHLGYVWLHDIEGALLNPRNERLTAGQNFAAGDR